MTSIKALSPAQRRMLIRHIDGPVLFDRADGWFTNSLTSLIRLKFVRGDQPGPRPRQTVITELGRRILAAILADYAETLIEAGCMEPSYIAQTPLQILRRLKASRKPVSPETALEPAKVAVQTLEK